MPTRSELESLAHDHFASDLMKDDALVTRMTTWTLVEAEAYLESNGSVLPESEKVVQAPRLRKHERALLCLHSSAGSGEILEQQLKSLKLHESFDLDFLNGKRVMDPAEQPEAAMLRKFFPNAPNLSYLSLVEVDDQGIETPVRLATNKIAAGTGSINIPDAGSRKEYRGLEEALALLSLRLASASLRGERYEGILALSQGANLLTILLALLEAAEVAAAAAEAAAANLPPGETKTASRAAARESAECAIKRARLLRPLSAVLFSGSEFGWARQLSAEPALAARCLEAVDSSLAQLGMRPEGPPPPAELHGVFGAPLASTKVLVVLGKADPVLAGGRQLAALFASGAASVLEHGEGHKIPAKEASVCQRVVNFVRIGKTDELIAGCKAWYQHRRLGWLEVKVTKVDYVGEADGGATYCITHAELDGEIETVKARLRLTKPEAEGNATAAELS